MTVKLIKSELIYEGKVVKLFRETFKFPKAVTERDTIKHPGAVVIIPQKENKKLILIKQYRSSINDWILEFPAGTIESNEEIVKCAKRELNEEISMEAEEIIEIGRQIPAPGFCDEIQYCFLAKKLKPCDCSCEEDELIEIVEMSCDEIKEAIINNQLIDAKSIAVFTKANLLGLI